MFPFPTGHMSVPGKARAKQEAEDAKKKSENLPKKYKYYCPNCLYQTNEYVKLCPECRKVRLEQTSGKEELKTPEETTPETYEFYCKFCFYQTNEFMKFCPECRKGSLERTKHGQQKRINERHKK
jgi:RNA polymerase subunit RPABC4/transcription elongation factor Spt4